MVNENIKGYVLTGDLRNDNGGFSRWGFARKDGTEVFIKEFLSPVYPVEVKSLPSNLIKSKIEICNKFFDSKSRLYNALKKCNTGNIVNIIDFFRFKAKYYIVTEKIEPLDMSVEDVAALSIEQKHLICKIIIHCVESLHNHGIVHSDIKHDNILLKKTATGIYTAKLIDFDASFFESELPDPDDEFHGDQRYFAPESLLYMAEETDKIDRKIDVFALGLLFHQYFAGKFPDFDKEEYDYAFEAALDNVVLKSDASVPDEYASIIDDMLVAFPDKRPDLKEVFRRFDMIGKKQEDDEPVESFGFYRAGDL